MQIFKGPQGIKLEIDKDQNYEGGTPALVVMPNGDTGTYWAVSAEGETVDGTQLTQAQSDWLLTFEDKIDGLLK